jgi:hypothetical protein
MATYSNMAPFTPFNWKGTARVNAIPVFIDKLPATIGGLAGPNCRFGRVVSVDVNSNVRKFIPGITASTAAIGILIMDPTIMVADPAQVDYYYEGRPATAVTFGLIEYMDYNILLNQPTYGSKVLANNQTGEIGFVASGASVPSGWTAINASVYEIQDPNGVKIWLNTPLMAISSQPGPATANPVFNPAAGAVAAGTTIKCTCTTYGARILYTADGTTPTVDSPEFPTAGITITAATTFKAVAVSDGIDPSAVVTAQYTIS